MAKLKMGDKAPDFKTLNQRGETVKLKDLRGKKVALYFYPQDDTPTCTNQACNLRDNYEMLLSKGFSIYGISPDGVKDHVKFIEKFKLPFDLLTDEDLKIANAYGVWAEKVNFGRKYMGIVRSTFIIEKGIITNIIGKVFSQKHAGQIMK
ncbi:MAG: thioredoxin-dependent thiol peroxidase [Bacteroidia bacterium]